MDQPRQRIRAREYRVAKPTPDSLATRLAHRLPSQRTALMLLAVAFGGLAIGHGLMILGLLRLQLLFQGLLWGAFVVMLGWLAWGFFHGLHPWRLVYQQIAEDCSRHVQATPDPGQLIDNIIQLVQKNLEAKQVVLWRYDEEDSVLLLWQSAGLAPPEELSELPLDLAPDQLHGCWFVADLPESAVKQGFEATGADWVVSLRLGQQMVGVLSLGQLPRKLTRSPTMPAWLNLIGGQMALVASNVLLVTDLQDSRHLLQQAYRRITDVQEEERRNLATELHDDILGRLTTMALTLRRSQIRLTSDPPQVSQWLENLEAETQAINRRLREITQGLHPSVLIDLGLISALQAYLDSLDRQPLPASAPHTISLTAQGFGQERLAEAKLERDLYYITRQALDNAIKHANAPQIFIHLRWDTNIISITVRDTGCGMADHPEQLMGRNGRLGLLSMQERALAWGGQLIFHSAPAQGTTVRARLPVDRPSPAPAQLQAFTHYLRSQTDEAVLDYALPESLRVSPGVS